MEIIKTASSTIKVVMNWSSGKDAALAFHQLLKQDNYKVTHLLTTLNEEYNRIFMHGIREELLNAQADSMKLPLIKVKLPAHTDDSLYKQSMLHHLHLRLMFVYN